MDYQVGQLIDYRKRGEGGVHTGRIQYIGDEVIKIGGPPLQQDAQNFKRNKNYQQRGSWYWLEELEILSD